jgi:hypothetical protein
MKSTDIPTVTRTTIAKFVVALVFFLISISAVALANDWERSFSYPSIGSRFRSPETGFSISFSKLPDGSGDDYNYKLSIFDDKGIAIVQHQFMRQIKGEWSSSGSELYFNDFLGSTQIDCFIWNQSSSSKSLDSLTDILLNDPNSGPKRGNGEKPPETPKNSRFELTCEGWERNGNIRVSLTGDTWAGGHFDYRFVYSPSKHYFEWGN